MDLWCQLPEPQTPELDTDTDSAYYSKSMPKVINRLGMKYGRLMVISRGPNFTDDGSAGWNCICDCGVTKRIRGTQLSKTKSCGCLRVETGKKNQATSALNRREKNGTPTCECPRSKHHPNARLCARHTGIWRKFGMTPAEHAHMYNSQSGLCGICSEHMDLAEACVDHDHHTKAIRNLTHSVCNIHLGHYELAHDASHPLTQMRAAYLARHAALAPAALTIATKNGHTIESLPSPSP